MTPVEEHDIWLWLEFSAFEIKSIFRDSNPRDIKVASSTSPDELPHRYFQVSNVAYWNFHDFFSHFFPLPGPPLPGPIRWRSDEKAWKWNPLPGALEVEKKIHFQTCHFRAP
jgi:hypothetical protein